MGRIAHSPATLIHGRYDVSGPLDTARELHEPWPTNCGRIKTPDMPVNRFAAQRSSPAMR
jgi:pimeloyl-ACP methyl ester carboxylesterase